MSRDDPDATHVSALRLGVASLFGEPTPSPEAECHAERVGSGERYQPIGRLGRGGMGSVDAVWDVDLLRELALKRMLPALAADPGHAARFVREARLTASLDHPHIVPIHDLGRTADGELFFTMKRLRGRSLRWLLEALAAGDPEATAAHPRGRRLRVFGQALRAVAAAHAQGVLHRDLKPDNLIIEEHEALIVVDWGLARPLPSARAELRALFADDPPAEVSGTPGYMSPEQARGEPLDERSDVYALGLILYELATLERPYAQASTGEMLAAASTGSVRPLDETAPDLPYPLACVIARALAVDPAERYRGAAELAADLDRQLDGLLTEAEQASPLVRLGRWYLTHDPRAARLRVWQLELIGSGSFVLGLGAGALVAAWISTGWAWALVAAGLVGGAIPTWVYFFGRGPGER